jgi:hypothetical protein
VTAAVVVPLELLQDSRIDIEPYINVALATRIARITNRHQLLERLERRVVEHPATGGPVGRIDRVLEVDQVVINVALATRIARITNRHFTTGTGAGQPRGVVTAASFSFLSALSVVSWNIQRPEVR